MAYSKQDVAMHSDGYRPSRPAVNVKMHNLNLHRVSLPIAEGAVDGVTAYTEVGFTHDWIDANIDEEEMEATWTAACASGWEMLGEMAKEVWGEQVAVYSEGRSGGWAVVEGIKDFEAWDATDLAKWHKFEQYANAVVADIPQQMLMDIYLNNFTAPQVSAEGV